MFKLQIHEQHKSFHLDHALNIDLIAPFNIDLIAPFILTLADFFAELFPQDFLGISLLTHPIHDCTDPRPSEPRQSLSLLL